jgi:hypothetical protein
MSDQQMILILVIAFFLLSCNLSCNGLNENFTWTGGDCTCENYKKCKDTDNCNTSDAQTVCKNPKIRSFDNMLRNSGNCGSIKRLSTRANVRGRKKRKAAPVRRNDGLILPLQNKTNTCLDKCFNTKNGNPINFANTAKQKYKTAERTANAIINQVCPMCGGNDAKSSLKKYLR